MTTINRHYANDGDGREDYCDLFEVQTDIGTAIVTLLAKAKHPDKRGQEHWPWAVYAVRWQEDPDSVGDPDEFAVLEYRGGSPVRRGPSQAHPPRQRWWLGEWHYERLEQAAADALRTIHQRAYGGRAAASV